MGFSDIFSDFYNSIGFAELHAEAPPEEEKEDDEGEEKSDDGDKEDGGEEGGEEEGGDEEKEEEEEEEEEPEDPKPKLEEGKSLTFLRFSHTRYSLSLGYSVQKLFSWSLPQKWQA